MEFYVQLIVQGKLISDMIKELKFLALKEWCPLKTKKTGVLTPKQRKAVNFTMDCITKVSPGFSSLYKNLKDEDGIFELNVKTCESKDIMGELKNTREYSDKTFI